MAQLVSIGILFIFYVLNTICYDLVNVIWESVGANTCVFPINKCAVRHF